MVKIKNTLLIVTFRIGFLSSQVEISSSTRKKIIINYYYYNYYNFSYLLYINI